MTPPFHLSRTEVAENRKVAASLEFGSKLLCHGNAAPDYDHINVVGGATQKKVADISAHDVAIYTDFIGSFAQKAKDFRVESFLYFFLGEWLHEVKSVYRGDDIKCPLRGNFNFFS